VRSKIVKEEIEMIITYMKFIELPTPYHVVKAAWMGVGSQSIVPKNGTWHKWINEGYTFIKNILDYPFYKEKNLYSK